MCWAYRVAISDIQAANEQVATPHEGRITRAGQEACVLMATGSSLTWTNTRYGITMAASGGGRQMVWNARDDKLDSMQQWTSLIRQRMAIPIDAYVENIPAETWFTGPTGWIIGFNDSEPHGGAVAITEQKGANRIPIVTDAAGALEWLNAKQWNALGKLSSIARIGFGEADLFESKRLAIDARTRVAIPRAA